MKKVLFLLLLLLPLAQAQLYADVVFEVREDGKVQITGESNYDSFVDITNKLTSKKGELWLLNISTPVFEEYIYQIELPKHSIINYIKANNPVRIEEKGVIAITGTGSNKPLDIQIQYIIDETAETKQLARIIGGIVIVGLLVIVIRKRLRTRY